MSSVYSDVLLVFSRYCALYKKENFLNELTKITNLLLCFSIGILTYLPLYFSIRIVKSETEEEFHWELNEFGSSKFIIIYISAIFLIETLIPLTILTI